MGKPEHPLTIAQVAELKRVTPTAVLYAIREGRLPGAFRLGRAWAIPRAALDSYQPRAYARRLTSSRRVPRVPA